MHFPGIEKNLASIIKQSVGPAYSMYNIFGDVKAGKTMLGVLLYQEAVKRANGWRVLIVDSEQQRDGISAYHQDPYNLPTSVVISCKTFEQWNKFMGYVWKSKPNEWDKTILIIDPFSQVMQMKLAQLAAENGGDDFLKRTKKFSQKTERELTAYTEYTEYMQTTIETLKSKFEFVILNSHYNYERVGNQDNSALRMQLDYFGKGRGMITQKSDANIYLGKDAKGNYYVNKLPLGEKVIGLEFGTTHNPELKIVTDIFELAEHIMNVCERQYPYYEQMYKEITK